MRWLPRHFFTAAILLGAGLVAASGCADNKTALFIRGVVALQSPGCDAKADPSATMLGGGVMDVALTREYWAALLVGNQLTERGSRDQVRTETDRVSLTGAVVDVQNSSGGTLSGGSYTTDATGFVDPASGNTPSYGVVFVRLVPSSVSVSAGQQLTVKVHVFGDTLGGRYIESGDLSYPISVCSGCLVSFPSNAYDPANPSAGCTGDPGSATEPCYPGQDEPIDCRLCTQNPACVPPG
jgi:hypothetical protein